MYELTRRFIVYCVGINGLFLSLIWIVVCLNCCLFVWLFVYFFVCLFFRFFLFYSFSLSLSRFQKNIVIVIIYIYILLARFSLFLSKFLSLSPSTLSPYINNIYIPPFINSILGISPYKFISCSMTMA